MHVCPQCRVPLELRSSAGIRSWRCPRCRGRATTLEALRAAATQERLVALWRGAGAPDTKIGRRCPSCGVGMRVVGLPEAAGSLEVDVCKACRLAWFDASELARFDPHVRTDSPAPGEVTPVSLRAPDAPRSATEAHAGARLAVAQLEAERIRARYEEPPGTVVSTSGPGSTWKTVVAVFGLPVEWTQDVRIRPWTTWALAAFTVAFSLIGLIDLDRAVDAMALIPAEPFRGGGLTFVTSFFLHGGVIHLLGNLYYLLVFGDNVEEALGWRRFLLLVAGAALAGDLLHIAFDPRAWVPLVGASGGISGLLAFYALRFPRARIGLLYIFWFRAIWLRLPVWFAFGLWALLQGMVVWQQTHGTTAVSGLAHLGGALVGVALWWAWGRARPDAPLPAAAWGEPR